LRKVILLNQTLNVTNITYRTLENKTTIYNAGPELEIVNRRSHTPIRKLTVEKVTDRGVIGHPTTG
jgi:hypothetical protein